MKNFLHFEEQTPETWEDQFQSQKHQRPPFSSYGFYSKSTERQVQPRSPQED